MFALQRYQRDEHLLQTDATVLERVTVVGDVVIVIIRIGKERVVFSKDIRR